MGERGSVTAEFAVLLPVLVLLLTAVLAAATASVAQVRCIDAARSGARLAARHESPALVAGVARSLAPPGARVGVGHVAGVGQVAGAVRVRVVARVALPLPGRPRLRVAASSVAAVEADAGS